MNAPNANGDVAATLRTRLALRNGANGDVQMP